MHFFQKKYVRACVYEKYFVSLHANLCKHKNANI